MTSPFLDDVRPLHLVAEPGDRRSICGVKDPLPVCWARFALIHRRHRPGCDACFQALDEGSRLHVETPVPSGRDSLSGSSPTILSERTFRPPPGTGTPSVANDTPNESDPAEKILIAGRACTCRQLGAHGHDPGCPSPDAAEWVAECVEFGCRDDLDSSDAAPVADG